MSIRSRGRARAAAGRGPPCAWECDAIGLLYLWWPRPTGRPSQPLEESRRIGRMTPSTVTWTRQSRAGARWILCALTASVLVLCGCGGSPSEPSPTPTDPPALVCPAPQMVSSSEALTTVNYGTPTVSGGKAPVTVSCAPVSGSSFPVGTTPVTCTATDAQQRTASCSLVGHHFPPSTAAENQLRRLRRQHHGGGGRQSVEQPARPAGLPRRARVSNRARTAARRGLSCAGGEHQSDQPRAADRIGGRSGHPFAILADARRRLRSRAHHGRHQRRRLARLPSVDADHREPAKHAESGDEPERRAVSGDRATNGARSVRGRSARRRCPSSILSSASWRQSRA